MIFIPDSNVLVKAAREQTCLLKGRAEKILTASSVALRKSVAKKISKTKLGIELTLFYWQSNKEII